MLDILNKFKKKSNPTEKSFSSVHSRNVDTLKRFQKAENVEEIAYFYLDDGSSLNLTVLQAAAFLGDFDIAKSAIDKGADLHYETYIPVGGQYRIEEKALGAKRTALHLAVQYDHVKIVQLLLERGVSVDQTTENQSTPLFFACSKEMVTFLLTQGANVYHENKNGTMAMVALISHTDLTTFKTVFTPEIDVTDKMLDELLTAAQKRIEPEFTHFIQACQKVNNDLFDAANQGDLVKVQQALAAGAAPNYKKIKYLYSEEDPIPILTPLQAAVENNHIHIALALLKGADIDSPLYGNLTALQRAIRADNIEMVHLLLQQGADPNSRDIDERTALFRLNVNSPKSPQIARLLLKYGANANLIDRYEYKPIELLLHKPANPATIQVLLDKTDNHAKTDALPLICEQTDPAFVTMAKELIEYYAASNKEDLNRVGRKQRTALHRAVFALNEEIVTELLAQGVEVNLKDADGYTPLHLLCEVKAIHYSHKWDTNLPYGDRLFNEALVSSIGQRLLNAGANINTKSRRGRTLLKDINVTDYDYYSLRKMIRKQNKVSSSAPLAQWKLSQATAAPFQTTPSTQDTVSIEKKNGDVTPPVTRLSPT